MQERVSDRVLVLLSTKELRFSEIRDALQKPDKTIGMVLKNLQNQGLITKNEEGKYILTKDGEIELQQLTETKARTSLLPLLKKLFKHAPPKLPLEERMLLESVLSKCWLLPTNEQLIMRFKQENERLLNELTVRNNIKLYELSKEYAFTFFSFADEINQLRRYAFFKSAEIYGTGERRAEKIMAEAERDLSVNPLLLNTETDVGHILERLEQIEMKLPSLSKYESLESAYSFIKNEIQTIKVKLDLHNKVAAKIQAELDNLNRF